MRNQDLGFYVYKLKKALTPKPKVRFLCLNCKKNERPTKDSKFCEKCEELK